MFNKDIWIKILLPIASVVFFFALIESILWMYDYKPKFNWNGTDIPFWVHNAGPFEHAVKQVVGKVSHLTHDVEAYQEDFRLFYKLRPQMDIWVPFYDMSGMKLNSPFPDWRIVTDSNGRRCRAFDHSIPAKTLETGDTEIAFLGGSAIFGWGTDFKNTCVSELEKILNKNKNQPIFHCVDYAVPGYNLAQQLIILKRLLNKKRAPRYIILDATSNCDVPSTETDKERQEKQWRPVSRLKFFLGKFRLFNLMQSLLMRLTPQRTNDQEQVKTERIPLSDYTHYLDEFIDLSKRNHVNLILIGMCALSDYVERMEEIAASSKIGWVNFYDLERRYLDDLESIPFQDDEMKEYQRIYSRAALSENPLLYLVFPDECHPNPTGHRILALELYNILREMEVDNSP